jgi:ankyrin repeat protein
MQPRSMPKRWMVLVLAIVLCPNSPAAATTDSLVDAIRRNDVAAVKRTLGSTETAQFIDDTETTPLMYAALCASPDVIRILTDHGASVNATNRFGATALMWAATARSENVKALLALAADVNVRARNGRTALLTATRYGNANAMRMLLAAGADTSSPETRRDLLTASLFSTNPSVRDVLRDAHIVASSASDVTGQVLDWTRDDLATLNSLVQLGVNPKEEVPLFTVKLPTFFMAARDGQLDVMRAFVRAGVDAAYTGARGWTALMLAASGRRASVTTLQYLLDHGANVNARDENGRTALDWALTRGETEVSAYLRKAGGHTNAAPVAIPSSIGAPRAIRDAIEQAVVRLQPAGLEFSNQANCVSCHHQSVPGIAFAMAKARGLKVDAMIASHSVGETEERSLKYRDAVLTGDTIANVAFAPYGLLERIESGLPPTPNTDAMIVGLASRQTMDGSWQPVNEIRPPINGSPFVATALAIRALRTLAPPAHRAEMDLRVVRGRAFIAKSDPEDTQDRAFKLLGLLWSGAPAHEIAKARAALLALQRADGGWAQLPTLDPDAYATGQALYALHAAGVTSTTAAYRRAVAYLLRTQLQDGTWFVRTRTFSIQPYFETGFPHGRSQFISTAATAWATIALVYAVD